jgi:hypothetical protein
VSISLPLLGNLRRKNMVKRMLGCAALMVVLVAGFSLSAVAQQVYRGIAQAGAPPVGTEEPCIANPCVFFSGDFDPAGQNPNGLWNNVSTGIGISGAVYVPFTVPKKYKGAKGKTDWNVQGLFVNELFDVASVSTASWSIVQGVASGGNPGGGQVKTLCSGTGTPTLTATGRGAFGLTEYTVLLTGISCPTLETGTYWMTLVPTVPSLGYLSDVEDNTPANAEGPGISVIDDSFFVAPAFGFPDFTATAPTVCGGIGCDNFSVGVVGAAIH